MITSQNMRIIIGSVPIIVEIDKRLDSIFELMNEFHQDRGKSKVFLRIKIQLTNKNLTQLSKKHDKLLIGGPHINNLSDPFNVIGILQGIIRFAGLHSIRRGSLLLHASASMLKHKALCFADDGSSIAKTLSSIEAALISKEYIGDEFCFLNVKTKKISGYDFIPLHLRDFVQTHIETKHKMKLPPTNYKLSSAGYFVNPSSLFVIKKAVKLGAFIFVHPTSENSVIQRLDYRESRRALANTIAAHIIKLLNPEYDRMQFITKSDSSKKVIYSDGLVFETIKKIGAKKMMENITRNIPCFSIGIQSPCNITEKLSRLKF